MQNIKYQNKLITDKMQNIKQIRFKISSKLATVVEGEQKAPFSIATTPRCREGATPFPGLLHFTLDTYLILLRVKQGGIKYHFKGRWYDETWDWTQVSRTLYPLLI